MPKRDSNIKMDTVINQSKTEKPINYFRYSIAAAITITNLVVISQAVFYLGNHLQKPVLALTVAITVASSLAYMIYRLHRDSITCSKKSSQIDKLHKAHIEANLKREKERTANKKKSEFLANMSHEIRTPMNAIIGFCDILADEKLTVTQKEYVNVIRSSSGNLLNLINDILDFSKIESGKLNIEIIDCSVSQLISGIESIMLPAAAEKNLEFKVLQCGNLPVIIRTDPYRTRQCLINLASNAIKFTSQGHVYINVSIDNIDGVDCIIFDVEDTGIGIEPERQEEIFNSFSQADSSTSRKYGGTGLGLTITKQLAGLLNGQLLLKSKPGAGSVFTLSIPVNIDIHSQPQIDKYEIISEVTEDKKDNKPENIFTGTVLVVEDSKTNKFFAKLLLEKLGFEVEFAESGKQAVEKASNKDYDLIFMDIEMPKMNGYEATKILRNKGLKTPIIALTAKALKGDCEKCLQAGCDDYIPKPADKETLVNVIEKYIKPKSLSTEDVMNVKSQVDELSELCENAKLTTEFNTVFSTPDNNNTPRQITAPPVDWKMAIKYCGDEETIKRIAESIMADSPGQMQALLEAVKNKNAKDIVHAAHKLKGSILIIGAGDLPKKAEIIELAAGKNDLETVKAAMGQMKNEYKKFIDFLSRKDWMEISKNAMTTQK